MVVCLLAYLLVFVVVVVAAVALVYVAQPVSCSPYSKTSFLQSIFKHQFPAVHIQKLVSCSPYSNTSFLQSIFKTSFLQSIFKNQFPEVHIQIPVSFQYYSFLYNSVCQMAFLQIFLPNICNHFSCPVCGTCLSRIFSS